jgi:capsular polysaccharide biosynthesis protein
MNETFNEKGSDVELKMQELLVAYMRRWRLIALSVILVTAIALGYSVFFMTPMYRASATIYVSNYSAMPEDEKLTNADLSAAIHLIKGYSIMTESEAVLQKVAERLDERYSTSQLRSMIATEHLGETVIYEIQVSHSNPKEAARIANVVAEVIPVEGPKVLVGTSARMIDSARVPTSSYSPNYTGNALLGAAIGLLLSIAYVTVLCLRDTHIKDENDLTDMFELPILGIIPDMNVISAAESSSGDGKRKK